MRRTKTVAIILSFIMFVTCLPVSLMSALAEMVQEIELVNENTQNNNVVGVTSIANDNYTESYIAEELTNKRTIDSKQFLLEDGTIMQQQFATPVHYADGEEYREIDNTLDLKTVRDGCNYFENRANNFSVKLSEELSDAEVISIEKLGYKLDFTINDKTGEEIRQSQATLADNDELTELTTATVEKITGTDAVNYNKVKTKEPIQPNVRESVLTYKNVFQDVDFEYLVNSFGIKENIIVYDRLADYFFNYTIYSNGLELILEDTGEIVAYNEKEEAVFFMPAPDMTDDNGVYSGNLYYDLTRLNDYEYSLSVIADKEWFDDDNRAFPVKIDPAVYSIEKTTANGLTLYYNGTPSWEYNQPAIKFGKADSKICNCFMSFPNENDQFYLSGYQLTYSKLRYYIRSVGANAAGSTEYQVRAVRSMRPLSSITSFSQIDYSNCPILLKGSIKSTKFLFFNANHEKRWEEAYFNPEDFNDCPDMVFMWYYETYNDNQHGEIDIDTDNLPSVLNYYVSTVGIREDLPYEQFSYKGGTASINLINGAVTASFDVLSINVSQNPISLRLIYNDSYDDIMTEFGMHNMFGNNIKVNFQQVINCENNFARYVDEDGSIETLGKTVESYYSVDKSMTYISGDTALYINTKTKALFSGGKLSGYYDASDISAEKLMYSLVYSGNKITDILGYTDNLQTHRISFHYSGDRVDYVKSYIATSVAGTNFQPLARCDFTYDQDGNLIEIENCDSENKKFVLEYDDEELYGLVDFDGNGYLFGRTHWTNQSPIRMSSINTIYGESAAPNHYIDNYNGYAYFSSYDSKSTKVEYYNVAGNKLGERNVNRKFSKGFESEWNINDKGEKIINTSVSNMTGDSSQTFMTYVRTDYSTKEKANTSLSSNGFNYVSSNSSLDGTISSNHGIISKTGRQYCLSLMIGSFGSTYVEIYVSGVKMGTIGINGASTAYYIIPVNYYQQGGTTSIQIRNVGNNYVYVCNVSYNYYTSVKTTKRIEHTSVLNYVTSVERVTYDSKQTVVCDYFGRPTIITEIDYTVSPSETKEYTYTYATGMYELNETMLMSISDGNRESTYEYSNPSSDSQKTKIVTREGNTNISKEEITTGGYLGNYYEIRTRNGITYRTDFCVVGGNVRPYQVTVDGSITEYDYDSDGNVTEIKVDGVLMQQIYYGGNGQEIRCCINQSENYSFTRDVSLFGLVTAINYMGTRKILFGYSGNGDIESVLYANGATFDYTYNDRTVQSIEMQDSSSSPITVLDLGYTGQYLTSIVQSVGGVDELLYSFTDSTSQNIASVSGNINASFTYNYDEENGRITSRVIDFENGACSRTETFSFGRYGLLQNCGNSTFKTVYTYDTYDRVGTKTIQVFGVNRLTNNYQYDTITDSGETYLTNRVHKITNTLNNKYQTYNYNNKGYVSSYYNNQNYDNYSYSYDNAGRLLSDGTYTYTYDNFNNITTKQTGVNWTVYNYDSIKRTQLNDVVENGTTKYFRYDMMGNMIAYKGSAPSAAQNLYWTRGNMLASGSIKDNKAFSYKYDPNNLRYSKTVSGVETLYYWDDGVLMGEKTGNNYIQYIYDADGIAGMRYNGTYYYFEKNLFGDVLNVYDTNNSIVASFRYDSYGNVISSSGSFADNVKIRYRGYYYDDETGFYYLQTRYYDPSICRFISADQYELLPTLSRSLGELNLYSYCSNNPIMYTDESGEIVGWLVVLICSLVGATIGGTVSGVIAANNGIEGWELVGNIALGSLVGAAGGALLTAGGTAIYAGVGSLIPNVVIDMALVKEIVSIGLAVHNIIAAVVGPLMGVKWTLVEWGPMRNITPEPPSYSNIANLKSNIIRERNDISKYYIV